MNTPFVLSNSTLPSGVSSGTPQFTTRLKLVTHEYTSGDVAWVVTSSALVWLMLPGVGFFYSGLTGQKSALSMIMLSFIAMSVGAIQVLALSSKLIVIVVRMGVFARVFQNFGQIHRQFGQFWIQGCIGGRAWG